MGRSRLHLAANLTVSLIPVAGAVIAVLYLFEATWIRTVLIIAAAIAYPYIAHKLAPGLTCAPVERVSRILRID